MSKRLYVGNLPFSMTDEGLKALFSAYQEIEEVNVITNKFNGRSKGFGFVTLADDAEGDKAISEMNGKEIEGRKIIVSEAKPFDPDKPRPRRSFGSGGSFGGSRGRSGGFGGSRGRFGGNRERRFGRDDE